MRRKRKEPKGIYMPRKVALAIFIICTILMLIGIIYVFRKGGLYG